MGQVGCLTGKPEPHMRWWNWLFFPPFFICLREGFFLHCLSKKFLWDRLGWCQFEWGKKFSIWRYHFAWFLLRQPMLLHSRNSSVNYMKQQISLGTGHILNPLGTWFLTMECRKDRLVSFCKKHSSLNKLLVTMLTTPGNHCWYIVVFESKANHATSYFASHSWSFSFSSFSWKLDWCSQLIDDHYLLIERWMSC